MAVNGERYNSSLLFGVLTELNKGNLLIMGEYGGGKTTSSEYLNSMFNNLPLDLVKRIALRGHPQLTEEKIVARPHYGSLNQGIEKAVWQHFTLIAEKIIDEFNRIPEGNQSMVLNGIDRDEWNYLNEHISTGKGPLFATNNYADQGNNKLIPPILDRFDAAVESKFPGVSNRILIAMDYDNEKGKILQDKELTEEILRALNSQGDGVKDKIEAVKEKHRQNISNYFPTLSSSEMEKIREEIRSVGISMDALKYFQFLIAERNIVPKFGQKRSSDPIDKENGFYLSSVTSGSGSSREDKSIIKYAKTLAWMQGNHEINLDHLLNIVPHVLWVRMSLANEVVSQFTAAERNDPLELHIIKELIREGTEELPGVLRRFRDSVSLYDDIISEIEHDDFKAEKGNKHFEAAKEKAKKYSNLEFNNKGHPIFRDIYDSLS